MIIVLQCAARKHPQAGCMCLRDGRKVIFVADPGNAPPKAGHVFAHPDQMADTGRTWREELRRYNADPGTNPLGLMPAWQLYENKTYRMLAERYQLSKFYILSAGWGLLRADFLTPAYDITFSSSADRYKRRRPGDVYADFRMLPVDTAEPILFFASKEYVRLACQLSGAVPGWRYMFFNSAQEPEAPGVRLVRYVTRTRTNWHYECAKAYAAGSISLQEKSQ